MHQKKLPSRKNYPNKSNSVQLGGIAGVAILAIFIIVSAAIAVVILGNFFKEYGENNYDPWGYSYYYDPWGYSYYYDPWGYSYYYDPWGYSYYDSWYY